MKTILFALVTLLLSFPSFGATQTFKMYREPNHRVIPQCDEYTELKLETNNQQAIANLTSKLDGVCEKMIVPNKRSYQLMLRATNCGSDSYQGAGNSDDGKTQLTASLVDNRQRICDDMIPALIMLTETSPNGAENTLYGK